MAKSKKPQPTQVAESFGCGSASPKPFQERADILTRFKQKGVVPMAEQPLCVRLPSDLDTQVRSLPNRTEWLRDAILEKMQRERKAENEAE